jgi:hypothetical protein
MSVKGLAVPAAEMGDTLVFGNGATEARQSLPKQKQSKIRGILMVVTAFMLIKSGLKMLKNRNVHKQII